MADDIVRRFIIEGGAAAAAEMVTDKLKYGLFPSQPAYVELLKAATDNDLAGSAKIAVFERMILDTEAASPPAECFAILSDIVEAGERPAATAVSAARPYLSSLSRARAIFRRPFLYQPEPFLPSY